VLVKYSFFEPHSLTQTRYVQFNLEAGDPRAPSFCEWYGSVAKLESGQVYNNLALKLR